jgi:hypothetical protein
MVAQGLRLLFQELLQLMLVEAVVVVLIQAVWAE